MMQLGVCMLYMAITILQGYFIANKNWGA